MKTRKIIATLMVVTLLVGISLTFSACSKVEKFDKTDTLVDGLVCISRQSNFIDGYTFDQYILYDPDTLVMYAMVSGGNGTTMTVLYNQDGTLKLYNNTNE